jgi:hypothetical protein
MSQDIKEKLVSGGSRLTAALLEVGQLRERLDKAQAVKHALRDQVCTVMVGGLGTVALFTFRALPVMLVW